MISHFQQYGLNLSLIQPAPKLKWMEVFQTKIMMMKQLFSTFSSQPVCFSYLEYKVSKSLVSSSIQSSCLSILYPAFLPLFLLCFLASSPIFPSVQFPFFICLMKSPLSFSRLGSSGAFSIHLRPSKDTVFLKNYKIQTGMLKPVTFWPRGLFIVLDLNWSDSQIYILTYITLSIGLGDKKYFFSFFLIEHFTNLHFILAQGPC